jgi:CubicO group peptidase (beta-lactamase class C family)
MSNEAVGVQRRPEHWQAVIEAYQASRRLPTLVAGVLEGGELVWTGSAGGSTTLDTQYRIGSLTKTMTAVLVLQLRDEGVLDLDDALGRFVPESGYRDVTLRELLSHTSGMQSEPVGPWWERIAGVEVDRLLADNDGSGAVFGRRQSYHYSNLGFALLGEVVARHRGDSSWWDTLAERLLAPLGMRRTSYHPEEPAAQGFSVHHYAGTLTEEPANDHRAMAPAGQLWSTVPDLAVFLRFLAEGHPDVLGAATLREMATVQPPAEEYGLGVRTARAADRHLVGHLGSMPGFQAVALIEPDSGRGLVALTNGTTGFAGIELAQLVLGDDTPAATRPWVPSKTVPEWVGDLLGPWFWGNSAYELRWHNQQLEFHDVARGVLAEQFAPPDADGRIAGVSGYHHGETLDVVRRPDGTVGHLECATFVYTRVPYDPEAPIPGGAPA